jgi:hypothetical protein
MSLVFQPQDQIPHKTKRLPLVSQKEDLSIARIVVHDHKDIPFPPAEHTQAGRTKSIWNSSRGLSVVTDVRGG